MIVEADSIILSTSQISQPMVSSLSFLYQLISIEYHLELLLTSTRSSVERIRAMNAKISLVDITLNQFKF